MKNAYLQYVAVEGAKMAVVLGWSGSEGLAGPDNTGALALKFPSPLADHCLRHTLLL
jgi:hypothetical protein